MPFTNINDFRQSFGNFSQTQGIDSRKGDSYARGIWYLYEYLLETQETNSHFFNAVAARLVLNKEGGVNNSDGEFYRGLLTFLANRQQSSYLTKGFIKAAFPYLREYINTNPF